MDLYTMACRNATPRLMDTRNVQSFIEAFDECFNPAHTTPSIILQRQRNWEEYYLYDEDGFRHEDPFQWRVVWINPIGMAYGPHEKHGSGGVIVIEDEYLDYQNWLDEHEIPTWFVNRRYFEFAEHREPHVVEEDGGPRRLLHAQEVYDYFMSVFRVEREACNCVQRGEQSPSWP